MDKYFSYNQLQGKCVLQLCIFQGLII